MVHNQHRKHKLHCAACISCAEQYLVILLCESSSEKAAQHTPHESHVLADKSSMLCAASHLQETVDGLLYGSRATITGTGEELFLQQCLLSYPPGFIQASVMHTQLLSLFDVMHSIHILHSPCNTMLHGSCKAVQQDHSESCNNVCWCVAFHKMAGQQNCEQGFMSPKYPCLCDAKSLCKK